MLKPLRRLARRVFEATGLIGPYYRWLERRLARVPAAAVDDGRPMPPAELVVTVIGRWDPKWFSETGQRDAAKFMALAGGAGLDTHGPLTVLDFGCGCGRIARWAAPDVEARGGTFLGSDLNRRLVDWCVASLPGRYGVNALQPPLAYDSRSIDLVYAHSVFTHLTEATARAWLAELRRVLRPGGVAVLTFCDEDFTANWGPPEAKAAAGPWFVFNNALEGSNYMSAWTTRAHFAALASECGFHPVEMVPGATEAPEQAAAVLRA